MYPDFICLQIIQGVSAISVFLRKGDKRLQIPKLKNCHGNETEHFQTNRFMPSFSSQIVCLNHFFRLGNVETPLDLKLLKNINYLLTIIYIVIL